MRFTLSGRIATTAILTVLIMTPASTGWAQQIEQEPFGKTKDGQTVTAYTLVNKAGAKVKIIDYGAIVTEVHVPDQTGRLGDVVLGFNSMEGYLAGHPYFGANVGRCANRIAQGKFQLGGKEYQLATNNGPHALHGGKEGFDKKLWRADVPTLGAGGPSLTFFYTSKDGEEGYPGELSVKLTYTLTNTNALRLDYHATTTKLTVCNLAHHSYFNLAGHASGDVLGHTVEIRAARYTPADATLIPTGQLAPVAGTPFDFTRPATIGSRIKDTGGQPLGYDLNYVLDGYATMGAGRQPFLAARVSEPTTGRVLEVYTNEPGIQFYTGNFLDGSTVGKGGTKYQQYQGFCLEAQKFPDSINKPDWWTISNPTLKPGEEYATTTIYQFSVMK